MSQMAVITQREAKRMYPNQWVVMEVHRQDASGQVLGRVVAHTRDRAAAYRALHAPSSHLSVFYTGRVPKPGYILGF